MQRGKMQDSAGLYEPLVLGEQNLLDVEAIIVADLCVAYVMLEQNELADNPINRVTEEEKAKLKDDENPKLYHLSIIHLVIETLDCAHRNFDFGVDSVFKAFTPMHQKLNADTWFYTKKCLFDKISTFLDQVDKIDPRCRFGFVRRS
jgi:tetratricopeptide repeat protein 30